MKTNNMELNLHDMVNVCGDDLWDSFQMRIKLELEKRSNPLEKVESSVAMEIEKRKVAGQSDARAHSLGGFEGTLKGIYKVIVGK